MRTKKTLAKKSDDSSESDAKDDEKEEDKDDDVDEDSDDTSDSSDEEARPPTMQRCEHCDSLKVLQGILKRRMRRRVRATERRDSANLRKGARRGRSASKAARTNKVRHPNLHGEHSRAWEKRGRHVKREELPVLEEGADVDSEVEYVGTKLAKKGPPKKRHRK